MGNPAGASRRTAQQGHGIEDAGEPGEVEGEAPAEPGVVGDVAAEAADDDAAVDRHLVQPDRPGPRGADVVVGDQGEGGGNVERFTYAHQRAGPK